MSEIEVNYLIARVIVALLPPVIFGAIAYNDEASKHGMLHGREASNGMALLYLVSMALLIWIFKWTSGLIIGTILWWGLLILVLIQRRR